MVLRPEAMNLTTIIETQAGSAGGARVTVELDPRLAAVLDRLVADGRYGGTRHAALRAAFKEWADHHGYLPLDQEGIRPEDLNASNDD